MIESKREEILKMLEDDDNYYGAYGNQFMSNSNIGSILNGTYGQEEEDNPVKRKNLLLGSYFHTAILEPEKIDKFHILDIKSRANKLYKEHPNQKWAMLRSEKERIDSLIDSVRSDDYMMTFIENEDVEYEVPGLVYLNGLWWKLKADIKNNSLGVIVDAKTTSSVDNFAESADKFNYDSQAYIYSEYFKLDFIFAVADKRSHERRIFDCSAEFLRRGKNKVERAAEEYLKKYKQEFNLI